ncbi:LysR family transcriptional regulator [Solimonas sp. K1W22B-7]|uniref:LysR family transcriptional regulator n=1 Tax=Solimonas sp. K1W22B-7 TaxID=2303331 RepID=UPI000E32EE82|nr:LysR family transcriptional regulator [Solimonas sp. K1W22B-7]AXQ27320.1 LysR family transcriptional regulator [Solimonas sp. K1W22B-7]
MRLTLEALETLDAIEEHGSFARAAEALHRVPSAVTYTVQKLESDMGVALFDRSGRRARLTPAGRVLLDRGRELLRQAESLENSVKRAGHGWETQLVIAVDDIIPLERLFPVISAFDALMTGTRLRFTQEIFGGAWDALIDRRADLTVGAGGDAPHGYGLLTRQIGAMPFVFAVAPHHPLAEAPEPLAAEIVARYRSVAAADSSRRLPARSGGIQPGQDVLVMPTLAAKAAAQIEGLGVGYLPEYIARPHIEAGRLVERRVDVERAPSVMHLAWRSGEEGRALQWFRDRILEEPGIRGLLGRS